MSNQRSAHSDDKRRPIWGQTVRWSLLAATAFLMVAFTTGSAQEASGETGLKDLYSTSSCAGCHGQSAMGGLGPPIAKLKLDYETFVKRVREGKGMMPPTPVAEMSDADVQEVFKELQVMPWQEDQTPLAYKVGQLLTTHNISLVFLAVFGFSFIFGIKVLFHWMRIAGFGALWPRLVKMGLAKSAWIALRSLFVDGFLVISLFRRNRFRWLMHGLILYGFCGLILADILMSIYNPERSKLPIVDALKILPMVSGTAVLVGVLYVMYRYKKDPYIDNGLTLGSDFLFVNLLFQTIVSGFLTVWINRVNAHGYVMPIYIWHIAAIALLIATAPFTRFAHAFVVPFLVMVTRLAEAVTASGVDIGFSREPSPGRHHKSELIVADLLEQLGPEYEGKQFKLRYFP